MGTICLQCGDNGYDTAFIYCVKCLDFAVHRYCLDVIPETLNEFVHWVCDDCVVDAKNPSATHKHDPVPCQTTDHAVLEDTEEFFEIGKNKNGTEADKTKLDLVEHTESAVGCSPRQLVEDIDPVPCQGTDHAVSDDTEIFSETGKNKNGTKAAKIKIVSVEHTVSATGCSPRQLEEYIDPIPCHAIDHAVQEDTEEFFEIRKNKNSTEAAKTKLDSVEHTESAAGCSPRQIEEDLDEKHVTSACAADERKRGREISSQQLEGGKANDNLVNSAANSSDEIFLRDIVKKKKRIQPHSKPSEQPVISCSGSSKSSNRKKTVMSAEVLLQDNHKENKEVPLENHRELEERDERASTLQNVIDLCQDFPDVSNISAEPVVMPIWRGSFNIWNKKNDILGLVAHMSSKACQRVYETACQFEPVLHLEMLSKSDVWPKSFQTSEPSDDNIALYFFPSEASERVFDALVADMMKMELAMKALMQNAELLIFTSDELPLQYWRFQGKYYLWGVFRGRQKPPPHGDNSIRQQDADTPNVPTVMKVMGDDAPRSPLSPLNHTASYGSGTS